MNYLEQQLDEARRLQLQQQQQQQPPRVTPRKMTDASRSPSPPKVFEVPAYQAPPSHVHVPSRDLIYLPDHCPLTLRAVDANPDHLKPFRAQANKIMENELDELGVDKVI